MERSDQLNRIPPESISDCRQRLLELNWRLGKEHVESDGKLWMISFNRDRDEFVAYGSSPQAAWLAAVKRAEELSDGDDYDHRRTAPG